MKDYDDTLAGDTEVDDLKIDTQSSKTFDYRRFILKGALEGGFEYREIKYFAFMRLCKTIGSLSSDKIKLEISTEKTLGRYSLYKPYNSGSHDINYLREHAAIQILGMDVDAVFIILSNLYATHTTDVVKIYKQIADDITKTLKNKTFSPSIFYSLPKQILPFFSREVLAEYFFLILEDNFLSEIKEQTLLNILRGLKNHPQFNPDLFLQQLFTKKGEAVPFKALYNNMNDWGGDDNFSAIILELLIIWQLSQYSSEQSALYKRKYSPLTNLAYKQNIIFGFRSDEYDFDFSGLTDIVVTHTPKHEPALPYKPIFPTKTIHHLLQPFSMTESSDRNGSLIVEQGTVVPAFYLKAFDDKGVWENFEKKVWLVTDVIATFTGIGNLAKLRYLIKAGQGAKALLRLKTVYGIIEVSTSVMSIGLSLVENNENSKWVNSVREYLFWAQICTLAADFATSKILSKKASEATKSLKEYRSTVKNKKEIDEIDKFTKHLDEVDDTWKYFDTIGARGTYKIRVLLKGFIQQEGLLSLKVK